VRKKKIVVGSLLLLILLVFALGVETLYAQAPKDITNKVRFGYVEWPGVTVKTAVAKKILEYLGYEVESNPYMVPVLYKGLSTKDLDIFLGAWLPTMKLYLEPYFKEGSIVPVTTNLNETIYTLAVPKYVWDAGIHSEEDLHKYADKFGRRIIGIEPGNEGNQIMINAIKDNTYNLAKWELVECSTVAMLAGVKKAIKNKDWIVFLGWSPHWMNMVFDIKYLEDPLEIWGPPGTEIVKTITRTGFKEDMPNVYKFLEQFKVTPEIQNEWIYEYGFNKKHQDEIAKKWIENNLRVVDLWVYGVKSITGERARDAIRDAIKKFK